MQLKYEVKYTWYKHHSPSVNEEKTEGGQLGIMIDIVYDDQSKEALRITGKRKRIMRYRMVYAYPKGEMDLIEELTVIFQQKERSVFRNVTEDHDLLTIIFLQQQHQQWQPKRL